MQPGDLVRILDEHSNLLAVGLYLGRVVPEHEGITYEELQEDLYEFRKEQRTSPFFYSVPMAWHHRVIVGGRVTHLNTSFFTLLPIMDDESVSPV